VAPLSTCRSRAPRPPIPHPSSKRQSPVRIHRAPHHQAHLPPRGTGDYSSLGLRTALSCRFGCGLGSTGRLLYRSVSPFKDSLALRECFNAHILDSCPLEFYSAPGVTLARARHCISHGLIGARVVSPHGNSAPDRHSPWGRGQLGNSAGCNTRARPERQMEQRRRTVKALSNPRIQDSTGPSATRHRSHRATAVIATARTAMYIST